MTLATNVLKVRYSFSTTPLRMVFISGMPDPVTQQEGGVGQDVGGGRRRSDELKESNRTHGDGKKEGWGDEEKKRRKRGRAEEKRLISIQVVSSVRRASETRYSGSPTQMPSGEQDPCGVARWDTLWTSPKQMKRALIRHRNVFCGDVRRGHACACVSYLQPGVPESAWNLPRR